MAGKLTHRHVSALPDVGGDISSPEWNDSLIVSEGVDGQVMVRDSASPDGWKLATVTSSVGTYAARPASSANGAGRLYLPTDGVAIYRDSGSAWASYGPIFPLTEPDDSAFAWINQGTASVSASNGSIFLRGPVSASDNLRIRKRSAPATPYVITAGFISNLVNLNFQAFGLIFRQSSDGKLCTFSMLGSSNTGAATSGSGIEAVKYTNPTTFSASYQNRGFNRMGPIVWLRIADNGTNRICSFSADGINFVQYHSIGRTDFLTADEVGFMVNDSTNTYEPSTTLISWQQS
jgi:hypothetical protein